jgi:hypothetical protein
MYFHYQNLKKDEKSTRYLAQGRFWLGQKPQLHCEWTVPGRDLSLQLDLNHYGDTAIGGHIGLYFFTLYWGIEWNPLYRLLEKITRRRDQKYTNGRSIGFHLGGGALSLMGWDDPMESRGTDPWWWHQYINLDTFFLGRSKCTQEILETREVEIPMPEKSYKATANLVLYTWTRPRWFKKQIKRVDIKIPEGIPFEGKGENSWDCGHDATYGITTGECHSIPEGVGMLVGSVLRDRVKNGGYGDWNWKKSAITSKKGE